MLLIPGLACGEVPYSAWQRQKGLRTFSGRDGGVLSNKLSPGATLNQTHKSITLQGSRSSFSAVLLGNQPPVFYEAMQVIWAKGGSISVVKVVVAVAIKGAAETLRVAVVHAGCPDRQTHPPVAHVGPDKCPRREDQLRDHAINKKNLNKTSPLDLCHLNVRTPTVTFFPWCDSKTRTRGPSRSPSVLRVSRGRLSCGCPSHMSKTATSLPSRAATPQPQATA